MTANARATATRAGFAALIGAPNAGKSTLLNRLVGSKVSIVTHKIQTTRTLVRGIVMHADCQIIFVDTPGIFRPKKRLDTAMVSTAWAGARDADMVVMLLDAERGITGPLETVFAELASVRRPKLLAINKIDAVARDGLLALAERANALVAFERTFMISALTGDGCADLLDHLAANLPQGPFLYPPDQASDMPMRLLAAELTREKLTLRLHQELPYACHVETDSWQEQANGSIRVEQTIYVERASQKKIVLGKAGAAVKAISSAARHELEQIVGARVHLFVFVKVRERWGDDPERYRQLGLEFPRG